jgi:hypothetical protein
MVVGWILTKDSWLLHIWLSWCLMSIETWVSCCIHDEKFRLQWPKLYLFFVRSNRRRGTRFIFSQITAQWSVNLFEIHCHSTRWSGAWIVTLIILHYILVTIIGVRIKYRFYLGMIKLTFRLEILTYFLWMLNAILIERDFQISFDSVVITVFVGDIIIIYIGSWVIITVVVLLSCAIHLVWGQLIVSFKDNHRLEIGWL